MKHNSCHFDCFSVRIVPNIRLKTKSWVIKYLNKTTPIQIVATKKTFRKAVSRNLARRRFLNAILQIRSDAFGISRTFVNGEFNILYKIYLNKPIIDIDFEKLIDEVKNWIENRNKN